MSGTRAALHLPGPSIQRQVGQVFITTWITDRIYSLGTIGAVA